MRRMVLTRTRFRGGGGSGGEAGFRVQGPGCRDPAPSTLNPQPSTLIPARTGSGGEAGSEAGGAEGGPKPEVS
jgi:hypothetical protein